MWSRGRAPRPTLPRRKWNLQSLAGNTLLFARQLEHSGKGIVEAAALFEMPGVTFFGLSFTPVFYVALRKLSARPATTPVAIQVP